MKITPGQSMLAARLHGPRDLRVERLAPPGDPGPGQVRLSVTSVGICGSDLHTYLHARIGDTVAREALILGHEFAGIVQAAGPDAHDGNDAPLAPGTAVAVDPAQPCHRCEMCIAGHPNLCWRLHFCGLWPDNGSLCESMLVPARCCFPVPASLSAASAALLEPLGVALFATDLAKVRVGDSAAVLGAGPIGLLILQALRCAGANPIFVTDRYPWRLRLAERFGAIPINIDQTDPVRGVLEQTQGRGVDVAVEAAWCGPTVDQAAEMARLGGRLVLVGISADDELKLRHSTARRKGLSIKMSRRMKHTYARALQLVSNRQVDVESLVSHRFPLSQAAEAFALNAAYSDGVVKIIVDCSAG